MLLHDTVQQGHHKILLRTIDVLVLAVAINNCNSRGGWNYGLVLAYIFVSLQFMKCLRHYQFSLISLDVTLSCYGGRGKKMELAEWKSYWEVNNEFLAMAHSPSDNASLSCCTTGTARRQK